MAACTFEGTPNILAGVLVSDFGFDLPSDLIAQTPLPERDASRLLHLYRNGFSDGTFRDFPDLLQAGDLLVFNNTRVFPARLLGSLQRGNKDVTGKSQVEVLLTRQTLSSPNEWECLVRPGKKVKVGDRIGFGAQDELWGEIVDGGAHGERRIRFSPTPDFFSTLQRVGHTPLPPYIDRGDDAVDGERYQTVYARERGSVAAPTAGLHFTPAIFARLRERGIETAEITLHVGLGTFQPLREEVIEGQRLHNESYSIPEASAALISSARSSGRRVIAVGTTTVRTLEHAALISQTGEIAAGGGDTEIFIYPGFQFRVVSGILTNFHLSRSSLLMLVCAFGGKEQVLQAYAHAVEQRYRFYSYGDCMFLE